MTESTQGMTKEMMEYINSYVGGIMSQYIKGERTSPFFDAHQENKKGNYDDAYVDLFANQLKLDIIEYKQNRQVTECAFFAPRKSDTNEQKKKFVYKIAFLVFPPKLNDQESRTKSHISYQKTLSLLSTKFKDQEFQKIAQKTKFKMARLAEHRELWESLKTRPLSELITNPTAMPVEVSREEELDPFFNFLEKNENVDHNKHLEYDTEWLNDEECFKFNKGAVYTDGRMDLCKQVVGPLWINKLMNSLKKNEHIKHFLLGNNIIGTIGALAIKNFMQTPHKSRINTWYIAGNAIDSTGIEYIVDAFENDTDIKELWLKRNPICVDGMKHINRLLKNNKSIITLDLHNTATLDEGVKQIFDGLKENTTLENLYLEANGITHESAKYISEYFDMLVKENRKGLTSLWIGMNKLGDDGVIEIVNSLKNYKYIERLCVGSNMITGIGMKAIYNAFKDHPTLRMLDVGMYKSTADMEMVTNRVSDEGAKYIADLIKENKVLEYISILHNDISNEGIKLISEALQKNNTLLFLDFKQYFVGIDQPIHKSIMDKLKQNRESRNIGGVEKEYQRYLKHTKEIVKIDSIYRNKKYQTCGQKKTCSIKNH